MTFPNDDGSRRQGARAGALALVAAVTSGVVVPAGFLVWLRLRHEETLPSLSPPPVAVVVDAEPYTPEPATLDLTLVWADPEPIRWAGLAGKVTRVAVAPGAKISSGSVVAEVDGVEVVAHHSEEPFYRPLGTGSRGSDVAALEGMLTAAGLLEGAPDDVFDRATTAALKEWQRARGVPEPTGVLDPATILWLPEPTVVVDEVALAVGAPAPGWGEAVLIRPAVLGGAEGPWPEGLPEAQRLDVIVGSGTVTGVMEGERVRIVPEGLAALADALFRGAEAVTLPVRPTATVGDRWAVPTRAVAVGPDATPCVWTPSGTGYDAVEVTVVGSTPSGETVLSLGSRDVPRVLVNPDEILDDPTCPSQ